MSAYRQDSSVVDSDALGSCRTSAQGSFSQSLIMSPSCTYLLRQCPLQLAVHHWLGSC